MGEGKSLINLGDLSKPATVLIEKVSDAIGWVVEPYQVKRMAKAEVEAEKIKALGKIEISGIEQRAMHRLIAEESIKQENIENITAKAIKELNEDAKPENLERDWVANFFDKCRLVSEEEMQSLWSRLLAEEANKSGSFSKRTIELVATFDKEDAHLFTKLMGFGWSSGDQLVPLVYHYQRAIYNQQKINFDSLMHLEAIGLIKFDDVNGFAMHDFPKISQLSYFGKHVRIEFPEKEDNVLEVGIVLLTNAGRELAPICGATHQPNFLEYVFKIWKEKGYKCSSA